MAFIYSAFADEIGPEVTLQIQELTRHGIGYVEFRSAGGRNVLDIPPDVLADIAGQFNRAGIKVSALGSPVGKVPVDTPYDVCMEQIRQGIQACKAMGTDNLRVFSYYTQDAPLADCRTAVLKRMEGMMALAAAAGINLLLENELHLYGEDAPHCLDILKTMDSEVLRLTFDPSNFVQCGQDVEAAYGLLYPYLRYVHLKDSVWQGSVGDASMGYQDAGDAHRPVGLGDGRLAWLAARLKQDGYDGFVSIEPHLAQVASVPGTGAQKFDVAVAAARQYY